MEILLSLIEPINFIISFILHIDDHLHEIIADYGAWSYAILFLIVFCETGLIVTPYLPGDSLLFAAGALAALGAFSLPILIVLLIAAAIIGDAANYWIASKFGHRALTQWRIPLVKMEHVTYTRQFFDRHGGKTIVIARFIPIVRTFAPFVAGISEMKYRRFMVFNVFGAFLWVGIFVPAGYAFGNIPAVKEHFSLLILAIIGLSVLPIIIKYLQTRFYPAVGSPN